MRKARLDLRAVIYQDDRWWIAHCLELDLPAEGKTPQEAVNALIPLIALQVDAALEHDDLPSIFRPAPPEIWTMFTVAASKRFHIPPPPKVVSRFKVRQLQPA